MDYLIVFGIICVVCVFLWDFFRDSRDTKRYKEMIDELNKDKKGLSNAQAKCLKSFRQKSARLLCLHRELIRQCKDNNNYLNNKDMTEELKKALTERFEQLSSSVDCDEQVNDALLKAYLAGGEYGYELGVKSFIKVNLSGNV